MDWLRNMIVWLRKPQLVRAAKRGNLNKVQRVLEGGADVNIHDGYGRTALMEACREGHVDVVRWLLEHEADCEKESFSGTNAIQYAKSAAIHQLLYQHLAKRDRQELRDQKSSDQS
jgi:ankyrin repeat protein